MKKLIAILVSLVVMLAGPTASAQDYSGPASEDGVFEANGPVGPGSVIKFSATGLMPGAPVQVTLLSANGSSTEVGSVAVQGASLTRLAGAVVGDDGSVSLDITMPDELAPGNYTLEIRSTRADGSPFISRISFTAGGELGGVNALALTGTDTTSYPQIAILLIALGAGIVLIANRKRAGAKSEA